MLGGIYSSEKCGVCGKRMLDNGRFAVWCPVHKNQRARSLFVRFGRTIQKRFTDYEQASRFLNGLRFKKDEGSFDARDYQTGNPLGFSTLASKYLEIKQQIVKSGTYSHIKQDLGRACNWFGNLNVKEIQYAEIEDFLLSIQRISEKTRSNIRANLHAFFSWLVKRRVIRLDQLPEFPNVPYELRWRKTVGKDIQQSILERVKTLSAKNPRIWLGAKFLSTYISLRPGDLRNILEEDIDLERQMIIIRSHKTSKFTGPKLIPLLEEDVEIIRALTKGFPKMPFFRRERGGGGRHAGTAFGKHLVYDYWKRACDELGITGVDLYGGTRHSSMQALRKHISPESIKRLSMHTTNKALDRYIEIQLDELRDGYALTRECSTTEAPKKKSRPS